MTKKQAIQAMHAGYKVSHPSLPFPAMSQDETGAYWAETKGEKIHNANLWPKQEGREWEDGYSLFTEQEVEPLSHVFVDASISDTEFQIFCLRHLLNIGGHSDEKRAQIEQVIGLFRDYIVKLTEIRNQLPEQQTKYHEQENNRKH